MRIHRAKSLFGALGVSAGILCLPAPAQAQFTVSPTNLIQRPTLINGISQSVNSGNILFSTTPFNPNSDPGGLGLFAGLPGSSPITLDGWIQPTTTTGSNALNGIFGNRSNNSPLGGLLGGNNPLGNVLGGSGDTRGGDLISVIQGVISNIGKLSGNPLEFIAQLFQGNQSPLGESLAVVEDVLKQNQSEMGLPDLAQAKADVWKANTATNPYTALDLFQLKQGQVTSRATQSHTQTILGKEGQKLQLQGMQAVQRAIGGANQIVQTSGQVAQQTNQFAQQASQVAQVAAQVGQQSTQTAAQTTATAGKIKSAISTQDAIKGLGEQNSQLANILSGISNQMGSSANELSSVASELSGLSNQQAQAAVQLGQVAAINGDQAVSLRNLQVSSALSNANLHEMTELMHGKKRQESLEKEALVTLPAANPFILFK
jgi:hypothetical protein